MAKYITAIDLGTHKIKAAIGERTLDGIKVVAYSEFPSNGIIRGEINFPKRVVDVLTTTIQDLKDCNKGDMTTAFFNLSAPFFKVMNKTLTRHRDHPMSYITLYELNSMLKEIYKTPLEDREKVIYAHPMHYNLDEHISYAEIEGRIGSTIEGRYRLCIGSKGSLDSINFVAKETDLVMKKAFFTPVASASSILSDEDRELGVALVDIGAGTTDILVYLDKKLKHIASIPFGGNSITHDIREECSISMKDAERLKIMMGSCISKYIPGNKNIRFRTSDNQDKMIPYQLLADTIQARCLEIFATVNREIHESGVYNSLKGGLILTGGGSNLAHIDVLASAVTGLDVRTLVPSKNLIDPESRTEIFQTSSATLAGLLIEGMRYTEMLEDPKYYGQETDIFGEPVKNEEDPKTSKDSKPAKPPKPRLIDRIKNGVENLFKNTDDEV